METGVDLFKTTAIVVLICLLTFINVGCSRKAIGGYVGSMTNTAPSPAANEKIDMVDEKVGMSSAISVETKSVNYDNFLIASKVLVVFVFVCLCLKQFSIAQFSGRLHYCAWQLRHWRRNKAMLKMGMACLKNNEFGRDMRGIKKANS